jgi:hypothetical protein
VQDFTVGTPEHSTRDYIRLDALNSWLTGFRHIGVSGLEVLGRVHLSLSKFRSLFGFGFRRLCVFRLYKSKVLGRVHLSLSKFISLPFGVESPIDKAISQAKIHHNYSLTGEGVIITPSYLLPLKGNV